MTWAQTDQGDILAAIRDKLITDIADFNDSTCFLTLKPVPPLIGSAGNLFCTVCPDNSSFNEGVFEGAGEAFLEENGGAIVSVFSRIRLDRNQRATEALTNAARGLLNVYKKAVLKALAGQQLTDADGNEILDNLLMPSGFTTPQLAEEDVIGFSLHFHTDFDWNLS